jgi:muramidase (phage lysozyme)
MQIWILLAMIGLFLQVDMARADALPLANRGTFLMDRAPMFVVATHAGRLSPSLFAGKTGNSLFAPPPVPVRTVPGDVFFGDHGPIRQLRSLIARAEAGSKGYDAVQYGAHILPDRAPTTLTLQQIFDWIDDTPGQPHAIGRYQFIPPTLRRLVAQLDLSHEKRFTPFVQDQLADILLQEAGLARFMSRELGRQAFMNNLAKIWAGLPNDSGESHYHGYAGNKAAMTWGAFDAQMALIFPG